MNRGLFITFEGTEGTGKSTQAALLGETLEREGREVVLTREPGGSALGRKLRTILLGSRKSAPAPLAELFLYAADRAQHMTDVVLPALEAGRVVICDRFADATLAYQGYGRGLDHALIASLNAEATFGRIPDLTLLLDFEEVHLGLERAAGRNRREGVEGVEDRFEREDLDFHRRVRSGYLAIAGSEPERCRVFDAALPVEELQGQIRTAVRERLPGS